MSNNFFYDAVSERIGARLDRLDRSLDVVERHSRADAREQVAEIEARSRKDRDRCAEHQANYDEAFAKRGTRVPMPVADERPPEFRRRLFGIGQSLLPRGHALTKFDARDLDGAAIVPFEAQLFEALDEEAENPSGSNLPLTVDDARARRERTDSMGTKTVEWRRRRASSRACRGPVEKS
jgi:hypothetical protein